MTAPVALTPLRSERRALRGRLGAVAPLRTGSGFTRSVLAAARLGSGGPRPVLVAGLAGALAAGIEPGDVVVADAVRGGPGVTGRPAPSTTPVPSAAPLAAALRALGLRVHVGPVVSVPSPVDGTRRAALARADPAALAVDTESAWLVAGAAGGPLAVVRVVVDTPDRPLLRPGTVVRGITALRVLRRAAPALRSWLSAVGAPDRLHGARRIGITAGVPAPDVLVDGAVSVLSGPGSVTVGAAAAVTEDVSFAPPRK